MSDELIYEMVSAAQGAFSPVVAEAYARVEADVATLAKLLVMVEGEPSIAHNRTRGLNLLDQLTQPVLLDVAITIVRAIDDASQSTGQFIASRDNLQALNIDRERLARRMGLERGLLELATSAMTNKLALLTEQCERVLTIDDRNIALLPPTAVAEEQRAAVSVLEKVAGEAGTNVFIVEPLAELYLHTGREAEGAQMLERLVVVASQRRELAAAARLYQRLARAYKRRGDLAAALSALSEANKIDPTDITTLVFIGNLHFESGEFQKAKEAFQRVVTLDLNRDTPQVDAFVALSKVNAQLGDTSEAKAVVKMGLSLAPQSDKLLRLDELLSSLPN